jgi:hypothetical protein
MTRLEALEAVADAARRYCRARDEEQPSVTGGAWVMMLNALMALDALPTAPAQGETVEVAVWRVGNHFELTAPGLSRGNHCEHIGTTLLPIRATVAGKVTL